MKKIKYHSKTLLESLSTKRLLALQKKVRPKIRSYINLHYCECCGTPTCDLYAKNYSKEEHEKIREEWQKEIDNAEGYLSLIKSILNTREHIKK